MTSADVTSLRALVPPPGPRRRDALVGAGIEVPRADGRTRRYVEVDHAASTAALAGVWDGVEAFVPWYSSVHRGSGLKSQVATAAYEDARQAVAEFLCARHDDVVVLAPNTAGEAFREATVSLRVTAISSARAPRPAPPAASAQPARRGWADPRHPALCAARGSARVGAAEARDALAAVPAPADRHCLRVGS
jgi:hypothetical protein